MKIYHQLGFREIWNINSYINDKVGDGAILSPVHVDEKKMMSIANKFGDKCFFDPQFYVPDSQKEKLNSYDFFPEAFSSGFETSSYESYSFEAAKRCLDYQISNNFEGVIIPTRYYPEMVSNFIERQSAFSVTPFINVIRERDINNKDIFLTLALSISTIQDKGFREIILNWVTSYPEISGIYLAVNFNETSKQICEYNKLIEYFSFIKELKDADLKIICGYTGLEELMLCCMDVDITTMGVFENTRKFDIDKFLDNEKTMRGPAPRIYFPKLMNSIRFDTANAIRQDHPKLWEKIYTPTVYSEKIFNDYVIRNITPHFTKAEQYMHYFVLVSEQINSLLGLPFSNRINDLKQKIKDANRSYQEIDANEILWFDRNCSGDHLPCWLRATKWIEDNC